jgi:hypothetical protein
MIVTDGKRLAVECDLMSIHMAAVNEAGADTNLRVDFHKGAESEFHGLHVNPTRARSRCNAPFHSLQRRHLGQSG